MEKNNEEPESPRFSSSSDGSATRVETSLGGVYRIRARVLPYLTGFVHLAPFEDGWALIDSGSGTEESNEDIERGFEVVRREFEPTLDVARVKRIFLTHAHVDHSGGASYWRERTGAEVWIHAFESRLLTAYDACARVENLRYERFLLESGVASEKIRGILDGFGFRPGRVRETEVARKLIGGERVGDFRFVYLPGHSPGHVAILFGDVVFSGDLLLSKTLAQIWPSRATPQTGVVNYLLSLDELRRIALEFERRLGAKLTPLPAHEEPIDDIPRATERALRGFERRNRRLLALLEESDAPLSLEEIANKRYWSGRPNREFFALSDVGARVEFLLQLGLLEIVETERLSADNPVLRYRRALFSDAESAENTVEKILRANRARYDSEPVERDAELPRD